MSWQDALLDWADQNLRDLPWRGTRDPWAVLVAEVMLQQTQVPRVIPIYWTFLERFPTPDALAAAPAGEAVKAWRGLGYNRRAVRLHAAATAITDAGSFPDDLDGLLALPGVGGYTARAVLVFAYERDVGVLDTNVARILARAVAGERLTMARAQRLADVSVPTGGGWRYNQALFDLGAGVCRPQPRCEVCPLADMCQWHQDGNPDPDPAAGSAGSSGRQSTFNGSDRQGRGRLVEALRRGRVEHSEVAVVAGWPDDEERSRRVAATLVADGLARDDGHGLTLP